MGATQCLEERGSGAELERCRHQLRLEFEPGSLRQEDEWVLMRVRTQRQAVADVVGVQI